MPRLHTPRSLLIVLLLALTAAGGLWALSRGGGGDDPPPFSRVGSSLPTLDSGFQDWPLCDAGGRIETLPWYFSRPHWGPATVHGLGGCGGCGGGSASFSGNPFTAGLGFALAPPNDIPAGDIGALPPNGHDHPFVLAGTGEVVYPVHLFSLSGRGGFDLDVTLTYRSGMVYDGDFGQSWARRSCATWWRTPPRATCGRSSATAG